jgi:hypothetical protein
MASSDHTPDDVLQIRTTRPDVERLPDLQQVDSIILRDGLRTRKEVVHLAIRNRNTGDFEKDTIGFRTKEKIGSEFKKDDKKSFTLENNDEITAAVRFIIASCEKRVPNLGREILLLPALDGKETGRLQGVINNLSRNSQIDILVDLLSQAAKTPDLFNHLMDQAESNPQLFVEAAAAINLARYRKALDKLEQLIEQSALESSFQALLKLNPWMFGSEYTELLNNWKLTRNEQADFLLTRTSDSYIELIEIKTPLKLGFARQGGLQAMSMRRSSRPAGIFCISRPAGDGPKAVDAHNSLRTEARASLNVA